MLGPMTNTKRPSTRSRQESRKPSRFGSNTRLGMSKRTIPHIVRGDSFEPPKPLFTTRGGSNGRSTGTRRTRTTKPAAITGTDSSPVGCHCFTIAATAGWRVPRPTYSLSRDVLPKIWALFRRLTGNRRETWARQDSNPEPPTRPTDSSARACRADSRLLSGV